MSAFVKPGPTVLLIALLVCRLAAAAEVPFRHRVVDEHAGSGGCDVKMVGDVNGDGLDDVIVAAKGGGEVIWYENPTMARHQVFEASFKWSCDGAVADVRPAAMAFLTRSMPR